MAAPSLPPFKMIIILFIGDFIFCQSLNGVQQPIYVYACHEPTVAAGLTKAVEEFFAHPSPSAALKQAGAFARKSLVTA